MWRYRPGAIAREELEQIAETAARAPSANDSREVAFVIVDDARLIRLLRAVSPGMLGEPQACMCIYVDMDRMIVGGQRETPSEVSLIDVGAAMENAMLACEALEVGVSPVTSFHRPSVSAILKLPPHCIPQVVLALGRRRPREIRDGPARREGRTSWQGYDANG